ncbi:MAG: tRNA (N(6)-L-threonylcarbamoyladenosine(37)-C(2))-methylthiotransferase MtaB, partial [Firmicutes bacterium]|nr:tRNA (N(6)-L-threonylcarbamoyladenosine(37)-C(2))-methylthiotransferase MtaB [Bacillota bacterium]
MKVSFYTLGCRVNQYETEALKEKFISKGFEISTSEDFADVYVVNTCTVTGLSDRKSRQYIRRAKRRNPDCITAALGCYVQMNPEEAKKIDGVDILIGNKEKQDLPEMVLALLDERKKQAPKEPVCNIQDTMKLRDYEETGVVVSMESRSRALVKVEEGCNRFCSYCVIPYARGPVRSRSWENVKEEARTLLAGGFHELVLTGINTALYGSEPGFPEFRDAKGLEVSGIEILLSVLHGLPGDFRIRIGSLEPTVVTPEYVKGLLDYPRLCSHLHLSLQSGSSRVLKEMNRTYDREGFLEIVSLLRSHDPHFGISTDIIVGCPGETDADFQDSVDMVRQVRFCKAHIFPYSIRPGTKAAERKDQIPPQEK